MTDQTKTREQRITELADKMTPGQFHRLKRSIAAGKPLFRGLVVSTAISPFLGIWLDWRWWLTAAVLLPMTLIVGVVLDHWQGAVELTEKRATAQPEGADQ